MRITYVTQTRFPTEKAHGSQIAQVCHALSRLGNDVTLLAPTVRNAIQEPAYSYYGLPSSFRTVHPGSFDALNSRLVPGPLSFAVSMWSYRKSVRRYLEAHPSDLLYARSPAVLSSLLRTGIPTLLELHTLPRFGRRRFVRNCNRCRHVICLTSPMRDELHSWGVHASRLIVEADAVDLERFADIPKTVDAKVQWGLPVDRKIIGYVGTLVTRNTIEKGVAQLIQALAMLRSRGEAVFGWVVGGPGDWRDRYREEAARLGLGEADIRFHQHVSSALVPSAIAACDVCVYPAPASDHPFFQRDTSPLKLFEYLAAERPIACADLPPLRDIVDGHAVSFCRPGDAGSLAQAIQWIFDHPKDTEAMVQRGRHIAQMHTWTERMKRILASS